MLASSLLRFRADGWSLSRLVLRGRVFLVGFVEAHLIASTRKSSPQVNHRIFITDEHDADLTGNEPKSAMHTFQTSMRLRRSNQRPNSRVETAPCGLLANTACYTGCTRRLILVWSDARNSSRTNLNPSKPSQTYPNLSEPISNSPYHSEPI